MAVYINGIGTVSPQVSFGEVPFLESVVEASDIRRVCIEPEYAGWIDPKAIRRMSKVIRMGVASAKLALKEAGVEVPDAIITGTAFGCLEDTGIFLTKMIENDEYALNPTPFIQSTHNTIGSQVALLLQCQGYNQTYSQRAFSFENSLLDALMSLEEKPATILVGGVDELTEHSYTIMNRFGLCNNGTVLGEGASYFLLSNEKGSHTYSKITNLDTRYNPKGSDEVLSWIKSVVGDMSIDMILLGENSTGNEYYSKVESEWPSVTTGTFKNLCGEYETANAFALWVATSILKEGKVPTAVLKRKGLESPRNILIYNHYKGKYHSLIQVEAC